MGVIRFTNSFAALSDARLEEKAAFILSQMTGNAYFPTPDPTLAAVATAITNFSDAVSAAKNGDRMKIALKNQAKEELVDVLHLLAAYVAYAAKGDVVAAQSSGFTLARMPSPAPALTKPQNLRVANTDQNGVMKLSVDRVPGAISYMHQYTSDALLKEESWQSLNSSQSKCTLDGLTPGTVYYFRVVAVGRKEQVMYSDVASRMAA